jgi:hypothetical protein
MFPPLPVNQVFAGDAMVLGNQAINVHKHPPYMFLPLRRSFQSQSKNTQIKN